MKYFYRIIFMLILAGCSKQRCIDGHIYFCDSDGICIRNYRSCVDLGKTFN